MPLVFNGFASPAIFFAMLIAEGVAHTSESTWFEGTPLAAPHAVLGSTVFA